MKQEAWMTPAEGPEPSAVSTYFSDDQNLSYISVRQLSRTDPTY